MLAGTHMACVDQAAKALKVVHDYITTGMETTLDVVMDLEEQGQEGQEKRIGGLKMLKKIMLEYSEMDRDMQQFIAATHFVIKEAKTVEDVDLEKMLEEKLEQLRQNNTEEELVHNEKYEELLEKIQGLEHQGASNTDEPMTEDIALTQQEVNTKCPYTGHEMTDPVKNKLCGHNYDREGIMVYIKNRRGRAKCPLPGCINDKAIAVGDLEDNRDLRRFIDRKNREGPRKK